MVRSGQEIQAALSRFVQKWQPYDGSEIAEAQTFLNDLFDCYGSDRQAVGAVFEDFRSSAGFMDLHWPGVCIIEMKRPAKDLSAAREQVKRYWEESSDPDNDVPAARWVVICSFQKIEVWEPGRFPGRARVALDLVDLPAHYDVLNFLTGPNIEPVFHTHHRHMTRQAAEKVAQAYQSLIDRAAAPSDEIQRFILQSVWCMFGEDLGMLEGWPYQATVSKLVADSDRSSASELGFLFRLLNQKTNHNRKGLYAGTTYVNGDLFAQPAFVELTEAELRLLGEASEFDWRKVDPTIFGSLMEGVLGERRWELGAHYTHEADIMKIVTPTIVRPWQERIDKTTSVSEARGLLDELCEFRVLDPACGCGNFLYVAYRELRGLEQQLKDKISDLAKTTGLPVPAGPWPFVRLTNMQGIDIEPTAVMIARVTLWMGHRQMIDIYGEAEDPLPLVTLASIQAGDALRIGWPETDAIIGNPPFYGSQFIRRAMGDDYVDWLKDEFKIGVKDFCTYWFRRAADHLKPDQRAGLVGTNSISQNRARSVSLDYVIASGGVITDAYASQKWPGEAKVHVSLVNWIHQPSQPSTRFKIDGADVEGINSSLRDTSASAWVPQVLAANRGRCFQGPIPVGAGFILDEHEAGNLLASSGIEYSHVVRPYVIGDDIADDVEQQPQRWIIDFASRALEEASKYPEALQIVRDRVKPERDKNRRRARREKWWLLGEQARGMRKALDGKTRYVVGTRVGKRLLLTWTHANTLPSDATNVFAFDDDFSMAVLQSRAHVAWAWHQSSTFKADLRYTPTSVFMTFPWPDTATQNQRETAAEACRQLLARRAELCIEHNLGLTKLYNAMNDGAFTDLRDLHQSVDEAITDCYGWPRKIAQDDEHLTSRLRELNQEIVTGIRPYAPWLDSAA